MSRVIKVFLLLSTFFFISNVQESAAASELKLNQTKTNYRLVENMEVLADPENKYTLSNILKKTDLKFLPANGQTSYEYSSTVYWIRFTVANETPSVEWMIQLANPFFDSVSLFSPNNDGTYNESTSIVNDRIYLKEINNRLFVFETKLPQGKSSTFYMRVETNDYLMFLPLTLWEKKKFENKTNIELLFIGGYYGIILVMLLYNLFLYISLRIRGYLYYVLYVLVYALLQFFWLGHGYQYAHFLIPYLPDSLVSLLGNIALIFGLLFIIDILQPQKYNMGIHRILQVCLGATLLLSLLTLFFNKTIFIVDWAVWNPVIIFPIILFASIYCWLKGSKQAKFIVIGWLVLMIGSSASVLMSFGFIPQGLFAQYGMPIGSAIEVVLFSFALAERIHILRKEYDRSQKNLVETQRRYAEDLEVTVKERTNELQRSNEQLITTEQERQRLLSNVSHDLKTPLTLVQGILESLANNLFKEQPMIQKYSEIAYRRVRGINRLIDDLTELSHLEVQQIPFNLKRVRVSDLGTDLHTSFKQEVEIAGVSFNVMVDEQVKPKSLMIDIDRLKQAFYNLLSNSMKHTPSGGEIRLAITCEENHILMSLSDTGAGISEEDVPHIFERFYQGSHGQEGTGLGLAIVREIIEQHQGEISVKRQSIGTTFMIRFPYSNKNSES